MVERTVVLSTFLLFAISVFAQNPVPQQRNRLDDLAIRGKLIMASGRDSDQRIEVKLEKSTMQPIQTTYTDSAGGFEFRNLAPGSYYISITLEGYEAVRQQVEVMNSFGNASVTIFLNKPAVDTRSRSTGLDAEDRDVIDISQMKENLPKKAVQDYEKALDEKKKGKIESAIKLLQEAIRVAPNFYHAHNNLGLLYQSLKRYMDAETEYKRSRELNAK
ncbi:MAG TPA: carboxypeptidase regulatory-like domain-containing protein, partial [Terriglobia bacterium]|nr:carboxypeptidase regulatory-like domain-containing protein [Terriglobia bacterium]